MDYYAYFFPVDRERIATALRFYLDNADDIDERERPVFERLLAQAEDV